MRASAGQCRSDHTATAGGRLPRRIRAALALAVLGLLGCALAVPGAQAAVGGEYTINGLASGTYKVGFFPSSESGSFLQQYWSGKAALSEANPLSVSAPNTTAGINAALQGGGEIGGRVTAAANGAPLHNIEVCGFQQGGEHFVGCAPTNANGEYTVVGLPSGGYDVAFLSNEGTYLPQYYNGQPTIATAQLVAVTAPNLTAGINAALQAEAIAPRGQISGRVTEAAGSKGPIAKVEACAEGEGAFECAVTNSNGEYVIPALPGGSYTVTFRAGEGANFLPRQYKEKTLEEAGDPVSVVAGATTEHIDAALLEGGRISGEVSAEGGGPLANVSVCASGNAGGFGCATTNASGQYTIAGLATGEYTVTFNPAEGVNYERQTYKGGTLELVKVTAPALTPNINAKLHPEGQISGTVVAAGGGPLAHVFACASGPSFGCATTNAAGEYVISALPTGPYSVSFFPGEENSNFLSQFYGATVNVESGQIAANINAALQVGGHISGVVSAAAGGATLGQVTVCAFMVAGAEVLGGHCALTSAGKAPPPSPPPVVSPPAPKPNSSFSLVKGPIWDAKHNNLDFFFTVANAGTFHWNLVFKNADVAFADSLGVGAALGEAPTPFDSPRASAAKKKRCKAGFVKHKRKCVHVTVPFGSGSKSVGPGLVEIKVHASSKAIKALKHGRTLHVSGTFVFQSALGGAPVAHNVAAVVREPKKHHKKKKKKGH